MAAAAATAKPAAQTPPRRREPDAQPQPEHQHLLTPAAAEPASGGTTTIGTRHVARTAIAPLAAARAALVKQAAAVHKAAAGRQKEALIDAFICRTLPPEWSPEHALMVLQNSCRPLDSHSRASVRAAFFKEENGFALARNVRPPPESLWPGTRARPSCKKTHGQLSHRSARREEASLSPPRLARARPLCLHLHLSICACSRRHSVEAGGRVPCSIRFSNAQDEPPVGYVVVSPGFVNSGVEVTLRKLFWLRVGVALARCVSGGSAMAIGRCTANNGDCKGEKILFVCADPTACSSDPEP